MTLIADQLKNAALQMSEDLSKLQLPTSIWGSYNPLEYAWDCHRNFIDLHGATEKKAIFLGMNPGPWGMAQNGIPFGEIDAVRNWIKVSGTIKKPQTEHPARPIEGFACQKSEVSGRRLWGLFAEHFPDSKCFFADYYVINYCPLSFMSETGANITPDKLEKSYRKSIETICDHHLETLLITLNPKLAIGVGGFARKCLERVKKKSGGHYKISTLLHPSPASPIANREWPERPTAELKAMGILR